MGQGLTDSDDHPPLRAPRLIALIASVLLGAAAALTVMPAVFRRTPTDISRIGVLLEALRAPPSGLAVAAFGNSVMMSGIDAEQLRRELPGHPLAWNLASTGQSLVESFLLTQQLPESVRFAVYSIQRLPGGIQVALMPQKYNTFYMFGFRPSPETQDVLGRLYGPDVLKLLKLTHFEQVFDARWAIRQLADTQLRILLRRDLSLASAERDLLHPQRYTAPIPSDLLERFLRKHLDDFARNAPRVPDPDRELARSLALAGAKLGRRAVFLLPPVHPGIRSVQTAALANAAREFEQAIPSASGALVIDATSLLAASDFIDDFHPTNKGAAVLTHFVAEAISGAN